MGPAEHKDILAAQTLLALAVSPQKSGTRQLGEPFDSKVGSDWISNLGRFNQAERALNSSPSGRVIAPRGRTKTPVINPDRDL